MSHKHLRPKISRRVIEHLSLHVTQCTQGGGGNRTTGAYKEFVLNKNIRFKITLQ